MGPVADNQSGIDHRAHAAGDVDAGTGGGTDGGVGQVGNVAAILETHRSATLRAQDSTKVGQGSGDTNCLDGGSAGVAGDINQTRIGVANGPAILEHNGGVGAAGDKNVAGIRQPPVAAQYEYARIIACRDMAAGGVSDRASSIEGDAPVVGTKSDAVGIVGRPGRASDSDGKPTRRSYRPSGRVADQATGHRDDTVAGAPRGRDASSVDDRAGHRSDSDAVEPGDRRHGSVGDGAPRRKKDPATTRRIGANNPTIILDSEASRIAASNIDRAVVRSVAGDSDPGGDRDRIVMVRCAKDEAARGTGADCRHGTGSPATLLVAAIVRMAVESMTRRSRPTLCGFSIGFKNP